MRPSNHTKAEQRSEIARQVEEYLTNGGEIEQLPPWATGVQVEISKRLRKSLGERVIWGCMGRAMLESWGRWGRSGMLGMGFNRVELRQKSGLGVEYSDEEMSKIDQCVARMPHESKGIVKRVFLHGDGRNISDSEVKSAISVFNGCLRDFESEPEAVY